MPVENVVNPPWVTTQLFQSTCVVTSLASITRLVMRVPGPGARIQVREISAAIIRGNGNRAIGAQGDRGRPAIHAGEPIIHRKLIRVAGLDGVAKRLIYLG